MLLARDLSPRSRPSTDIRRWAFVTEAFSRSPPLYNDTGADVEADVDVDGDPVLRLLHEIIDEWEALLGGISSENDNYINNDDMRSPWDPFLQLDQIYEQACESADRIPPLLATETENQPETETETEPVAEIDETVLGISVEGDSEVNTVSGSPSFTNAEADRDTEAGMGASTTTATNIENGGSGYANMQNVTVSVPVPVLEDADIDTAGMRGMGFLREGGGNEADGEGTGLSEAGSEAGAASTPQSYGPRTPCRRPTIISIPSNRLAGGDVYRDRGEDAYTTPLPSDHGEIRRREGTNNGDMPVNEIKWAEIDRCQTNNEVGKEGCGESEEVRRLKQRVCELEGILQDTNKIFQYIHDQQKMKSKQNPRGNPKSRSNHTHFHTNGHNACPHPSDHAHDHAHTHGHAFGRTTHDNSRSLSHSSSADSHGLGSSHSTSISETPTSAGVDRREGTDKAGEFAQAHIHTRAPPADPPAVQSKSCDAFDSSAYSNRSDTENGNKNKSSSMDQESSNISSSSSSSRKAGRGVSGRGTGAVATDGNRPRALRGRDPVRVKLSASERCETDEDSVASSRFTSPSHSRTHSLAHSLAGMYTHESIFEIHRSVHAMQAAHINSIPQAHSISHMHPHSHAHALEYHHQPQQQQQPQQKHEPWKPSSVNPALSASSIKPRAQHVEPMPSTHHAPYLAHSFQSPSPRARSHSPSSVHSRSNYHCSNNHSSNSSVHQMPPPPFSLHPPHASAAHPCSHSKVLSPWRPTSINPSISSFSRPKSVHSKRSPSSLTSSGRHANLSSNRTSHASVADSSCIAGALGPSVSRGASNCWSYSGSNSTSWSGDAGGGEKEELSGDGGCVKNESDRESHPQGRLRAQHIITPGHQRNSGGARSRSKGGICSRTDSIDRNGYGDGDRDRLQGVHKRWDAAFDGNNSDTSCGSSISARPGKPIPTRQLHPKRVQLPIMGSGEPQRVSGGGVGSVAPSSTFPHFYSTNQRSPSTPLSVSPVSVVPHRDDAPNIEGEESGEVRGAAIFSGPGAGGNNSISASLRQKMGFEQTVGHITMARSDASSADEDGEHAAIDSRTAADKEKGARVAEEQHHQQQPQQKQEGEEGEGEIEEEEEEEEESMRRSAASTISLLSMGDEFVS